MKKLSKILMVFFASIMMFGAVTTNQNTVNAASTKSTATVKTKTIKDQAGDKVKVSKKIKRIAVVGIYPLPSVLATFFDSADKIVGMPVASMKAAKNGLLSEMYPEILKAKTDFDDPNGSDINTEELKKLKPDVVFYSANDATMKQKLQNAGFTAVGVSAVGYNFDAIKTLNAWISLLSKMFPANDRAKIVKDYSNKVYNKVQKRVKKVDNADIQNVFFLFQYTDSSIVTSGPHFFGQYWSDAIGAKNVASDLTQKSGVPVNMEQIYNWNPQVIFITNFTQAQPKDLYNNSIGNYDWSKVDAVKNHRVYKMPLGMYRSYTPGVDTPITLLWLAKTAYPSEFKDINITKETKTYYKKVFNVKLTNKQAKSIFKPTSAASAY